ncbi:MAG: cytidine deaminase [Oscillospiraceae bacterium]|nr:cytidine deaminase [Oscillospiraceae bacterium]
MRKYPLTDADQQLIDAALAALRAGADGHYHTVGAAVRCPDGTVFAGVNCDGIHGACAEFVAVGAAVSAGQPLFDTIVAMHEMAKNHLVPPCGNCRQMLYEYSPDVLVILNDEQGDACKIPLRDLLPLAYEKVTGE